MLERAVIRNIALIAGAEITFGGGVCVFTGETGAGKSILLKSLCFAAGAASGSGLLRHGAEKGEVTLEFTSASPEALALLQEHDLTDEETPSRALLRRTVGAGGKGRAYVNDSPVGVKLLKRIGEALLEIHGQHDQRGFTDPAAQRDALDRYGVPDTLLHACRSAYRALKAAEQALHAFLDTEAKIARERDFYAFAVRELEELSPEPGLEERLAQARDALRNAGKIEEARALLVYCLDGGDEGSDGMRALYVKARRAAEDLARFLPGNAALVPALESAFLDLEAALTAACTDTGAGGEDDAVSGTAEEIDDRLYALRAAARKYEVTTDELAGYLDDIRERLDGSAAGAARKKTLERELAAAQAAYDDAAAQVSAARRAAASRLSEILTGEINDLHMRGAEVRIDIDTPSPERRAAHGADEVRFLLKSNAGMPFAPLSAIASGGELSRCMLAFKAALSASQAPMSMIFDEIDAGISGAVSEAVGARLRRLSGAHQVFAVTHQPQVAGAADCHYVIKKSDKNGKTETEIVRLDDDGREEEIARLISGAEISEEARRAAKKLLAV